MWSDGTLELEIAFHAGKLEGLGLISIPSWDELGEFVEEVCKRYYREEEFAETPCEFADATGLADFLLLERYSKGEKHESIS